MKQKNKKQKSKAEEERDQQIYEYLTISDCDEWPSPYPDGTIIRMLKPGINVFDWLLPEEKTLWDSLSVTERLSIAISCDPINALKMRFKKE